MKDIVTQIEERLVYSDENNPWVKLYFDHVRFSNGTEGHHNRIVESNGKNGVAILPIYRTKIGLVYQYRYPIDDAVWEIPRGFGESNDPSVDALRELKEEIGYLADSENLINLGTIHPNTGILHSSVYIFAIHLPKEIIAEVDSTEIHQFKWFDLKDIQTMLANDEITDSFTLSAILKAKQFGLIHF